MHHGDCCCGDGSLLVPICALQSESGREREEKKKSGGCTFCGFCVFLGYLIM